MAATKAVELPSTAREAFQIHDFNTAFQLLCSGKLRKIKHTQGYNLVSMQHFLQRLQLLECVGGGVASLRIIHVAGTKGKGSTCALVESLLRHHGLRTALFTSPHLVHITERFRIDGRPVAQSVFEDAFWFVWDKLSTPYHGDLAPGVYPFPTFFQFMTILAIYIFSKSQVDVAVLEVGIGGRLDPTNIIHPTVCGITQLDLDHTAVLGDTIDLIAREKGGIMKHNVPCVCSPQAAEAEAVLQDCSQKTGAVMVHTDRLLNYLESSSEPVDIGLAGVFQRKNAAVALEMCRQFLRLTKITGKRKRDAAAAETKCATSHNLSHFEKAGLLACRWPGRAHTICVSELDSKPVWFERHSKSRPDPASISVHMDGAHTALSIQCCMDWYRSQISKHEYTISILVFNCTKNRNVAELLDIIRRAHKFDLVIFSAADSQKPQSGFLPTVIELLDRNNIQRADETKCDGRYVSRANWQDNLKTLWETMNDIAESAPTQTVISVPGADFALQHALEQSRANVHMDILVTGSLYLVGSFLSRCGWTP
jgi:folylpolyglutamate synthase